MDKILYECEGIVDCMMVADILKNEAIPFIMDKNEISMLSGVPESLKENGWGKILVEESDYKKAHDIVTSYFQGLKEDHDA